MSDKIPNEITNWPDEVRLEMIERAKLYSEPRVYQYGYYDGYQLAITQQASTIAALTEDKNNLFRLTEIRRKEIDKLILELGKIEAEKERLNGLIEKAHENGYKKDKWTMAASWQQFKTDNNL